MNCPTLSMPEAVETARTNGWLLVWMMGLKSVSGL